MNAKLKSLVDSVVSLAKSISVSHNIEGFDTLLMDDVTAYLMYLSASDGVIAPEELEEISGYVGKTFTEDEALNFITTHNIVSPEFKHSVPESVKKLVEVDNSLRHGDNPQESDASEILLELYKGIGDELINSDGDLHISEETDMYVYLTGIDKYLSDYLVSRRERYSEKADHGVAAPKKK